MTSHTWTGRIGALHVLIEQEDGTATIATREHSWETWSAPTALDAADVVGFHAAGRAASTARIIDDELLS